jgi:hypothetical protein
MSARTCRFKSCRRRFSRNYSDFIFIIRKITIIKIIVHDRAMRESICCRFHPTTNNTCPINQPTMLEIKMNRKLTPILTSFDLLSNHRLKPIRKV